MCFRTLSLFVCAFLYIQPSFAEESATRFIPYPQSKKKGKKLVVVQEQINLDCETENKYVICKSIAFLSIKNTQKDALKLTFNVDSLAKELELNEETVVLDHQELYQSASLTLDPGINKLRLVIDRAIYQKAQESFFPSAMKARHPLLGSGVSAVQPVDKTIVRARDTKRYLSVNDSRLSVNFPDAWKVQVLDAQGQIVGRGYDGRLIVSKCDEKITLRLSPQEAFIRNGGLSIGTHLSIFHENNATIGKFHAALGYEVGVADDLSFYIAAESYDFEQWGASATIRAYLFRGIGLLPTIALGMGFPLRLSDDFSWGLRFESSTSMDLNWLSLSFYLAADVMIESYQSYLIGLEFGF